MENKDKVGAFRRIADTIEDNPTIGYLAVTIIPLLLGLGGYGVYNAHKESGERELEKARIQHGYVLYERNLNENTIPEKFYMINGKPAFIEIDGKPVVENSKLDDLIK